MDISFVLMMLAALSICYICIKFAVGLHQTIQHEE